MMKAGHRKIPVHCTTHDCKTKTRISIHGGSYTLITYISFWRDSMNFSRLNAFHATYQVSIGGLTKW